MTQTKSASESSLESMHADSKKRRTLIILALTFLAAVIAAARLHTFHEPLERDITLYAVISHEMLGGRELYSDLWEHKPPAVFLTFGVAELLGGYGPLSIYLLAVVSAAVTLLGLYRAAKELNGGVFGGLCAAGCWAVLSGDLYLQANQPNTEVFLNASIVWALAILAQARDRPLGPWRAGLIGALFAWASLYKQVVLVIAVLLVGTHWLFPPPRSSRRQALLEAGLIGCVIAAAWGVVVGYFAVAGRFMAFWDTVITFNASYAGNLVENLVSSLHPSKLFPPKLRPLWPFVALAGVGLVVAIVKAPARVWMLLLAYAVGVQITIALPSRFYLHYYQLWLPVLILSVAWVLAEAWKVRRRSAPWLAPSLALALIVFLLSREIPLYRLTADEWSSWKYPRDDFAATRRIGLELAGILEPGETFYTWGSETGLYFYGKRRPPSGLIHIYGMLEGPIVDKLVTRLLSQLSAHPPDLFLVENKFVWVDAGVSNILMDRRVFEWFSARYSECPVDPNRGPFILFVRHDSKLEARMKVAAGTHEAK